MDDFKRFYLGFYPDEKDVNMRPLNTVNARYSKRYEFRISSYDTFTKELGMSSENDQ
jgi:hypothetical protein